MILYGIPNCDTVQKARKFLAENSINYQFFDFKKQKLTTKIIKTWLQVLSWQDLLNKRSLTWRKLSDDDKTNLEKSKAILLMTQNPTLIKRPILVLDNKILLGFDLDKYQTIIKTE